MKIVISEIGDRWDTLAYDILGDSGYAADLMAANSNLLNQDVDIPPHQEIIIPEQPELIVIKNSILPPWQR